MKTAVAKQPSSTGMNLEFGDLPNYDPTMNILDVEVPWQLEQNVNTGIPFFNDLMGGHGMVPSQVMILTGTPGAGKSTFTQQLLDSLTGQGHVALLNSGEESLLQIRKQAKRLGLKKGFVPSAHKHVPMLLAHVEMLQSLNPGKQVVFTVDSIQCMNDTDKSHTNSATAVRSTELIVEFCKRTYAIAILISQVTKDGKMAGKNGMLHAVDTAAHLFIDEDKKSETMGKRIMRVGKNRMGSGSGCAHVLDMTERGLVEVSSYGGSADLGDEVEE